MQQVAAPACGGWHKKSARRESPIRSQRIGPIVSATAHHMRALLVACAPSLVLLTVAVRLLAVINPFKRLTLNTVATLCAAAASPIAPDVVPVRASVVSVPGTLMPSAASSAIAPSSAVTVGNTATADCCVPSGLCTNAP